MMDVVDTIYGRMIVPEGDTYIARALRENRVYSPEEFDTWRPYLTADSVVLDGGSHCGGHTAAFAQSCADGLVVAVEPQKGLAYALSGSCALNGWQNVEVHNHALGHHNGVIGVPRFDYAAERNYGAWRPGLGADIAAERGADETPRVTIDWMEFERLDFLKLDVEYNEWPAIKGAQMTIDRCRPVIVAEFNGLPDDRALVECLRALRYDLWLQVAPYGAQWPGQSSLNVIALPTERNFPAPLGADIQALA